MIPRCQPGVDCRPLGRSKFTRPGYGNRALLVARSIEPASANRRDWRIGLLLATPAIHRRTSSFDGDTTVGVFPGGIVDYSNGDACLRYSGLPGPGFTTLTRNCVVAGPPMGASSPVTSGSPSRPTTAPYDWRLHVLGGCRTPTMARIQRRRKRSMRLPTASPCPSAIYRMTAL